MAQKRIKELDLRANFDTTCELPVDDADQSWKVDGSQILAAALVNTNANLSPAGFVRNLGLTYAAGVLTVTGSDGAALSASNPGFVYLQSKANPGRLTKYTITAPQAFIDDAGASEIIGNLFGVTTGIAWGSDCPFYIYAVTNNAETAIAFMLSRDPRASVSPAEAVIGAPDDPVADTETSFFSFDNLDETLYDDNPCLCIGAIRMRMSTSDDWTVQTLTTKDGIGKFHESTYFTFPQNQNGAASGSHLKANGGTQPDFSTEHFLYSIKRNGRVFIDIYYDGDAGTDGSGAVTTFIALPVAARGLTSGEGFIAGTFAIRSSAVTDICAALLNSNTQLALIVAVTDNLVTHSNFGNGARHIYANGSYQGFAD